MTSLEFPRKFSARVCPIAERAIALAIKRRVGIELTTAETAHLVEAGSVATAVEEFVHRARLTIGHRDVPASGELQQTLAVQEAAVAAKGGDRLAARQSALREVAAVAEQGREASRFYAESEQRVQRIAKDSREVGEALRGFLEDLHGHFTVSRNRLRQEIFDHEFRDQADQALVAIYADHFDQAFRIATGRLNPSGSN